MAVKITVYQAKGGVTKTFWSLNISHHLGLKGYKVWLGDINDHHNAYVDCVKAFTSDETLPFQCSKEGISSAPNGADFIIYDCSQDIQDEQTVQAVDSANIVFIPVTPDVMDWEIFDDCVKKVKARVGERTSVVIIPNKAIALKNSPLMAKFESFLKDLTKHGAVLPEYYALMPDENSAFKSMSTRLVFTKEGDEKFKKPKKFQDKLRIFLNTIFADHIANHGLSKPTGPWTFQP